MHFSLQHVRSTEKSGSCTVRTNITRAVSFLQRLRQFTIFYGHTVRTTNLHGPCGARCKLSLLSSQASINTDRPTARIFQNHSKFSKPIFVAFLVRPAQEIVYPKTDPPASASVRQAQPPLLTRLCSAASAPPPRLCRPISTPPGSPIPPTPPLFGYRPSSRTLLHSRTESRTAELLLSICSAADYLFHRNPNQHGPYNLSYGPSIVTADTPTYTARTTPYTDRIESLPVPVPTLYGPYNLPYGPYTIL